MIWRNCQFRSAFTSPEILCFNSFSIGVLALPTCSFTTQAGTTSFFYFNNPLKNFPLSTIHFFTHHTQPTSFPTRVFHNHPFSSQTPFHLFSLLHPIPLPALYQLFTYKATTHRHPLHHLATSSTHLGTHLLFCLLLLFVNPTNITPPSFLLS